MGIEDVLDIDDYELLIFKFIEYNCSKQKIRCTKKLQREVIISCVDTYDKYADLVLILTLIKQKIYIMSYSKRMTEILK